MFIGTLQTPTVQSKGTSQSLEDNIEKREIQPNISKCKQYDKGQSVKLLSYHPTTDVRLHMEGGKVVDGFHHLIFHSITSNIMSWPFFLAFVPICNDDEKGERSIIE